MRRELLHGIGGIICLGECPITVIPSIDSLRLPQGEGRDEIDVVSFNDSHCSSSPRLDLFLKH